MTITIVGHGYVVLVTACVFADFGNDVWVVGHTKGKIDRLAKGDPIIYEPGLGELLQKNLKAGRIHFTLDYSGPVQRSGIVFITVGTPPTKSGEADLTAVFEVAGNIAKNLGKQFTVVSCKSTVPVGTNKKIEELINRDKPEGAEIAVASCPEFLREGTGIFDTLNSDRTVLGSDSSKAIDILLKLHEPIKGKKVVTDLASAELIKYASNAMLATKISFANLISLYCEKVGADVEAVLDAVGMDNRIGRIFMNPGLGYGGSCLPKDVMALNGIGKVNTIRSSFLDEVEKVNQLAKENFLRKITANSPGKRIALWGLAFKPDTDDIRFAPSLFIIENLVDLGYTITAYDREAMDNIRRIFGDKINYATDPYSCLKEADSLAVLTEWNEFKQIDLAKVKSLMRTPVVFDGRNIYDPALMRRSGFRYFSIGRP